MIGAIVEPMKQAASLLLYLFTMFTTLGMLGAWPVILLSSWLEYRHSRSRWRPLVVTACVGAGFIIGAAIGWQFRPFGWNMSFVDTLRAQTADHSIEYYAERVLLFVLMTGSVGAWLGGAGSWLMSRRVQASG